MKFGKYLGVLALGVIAGVIGTLLHGSPVRLPWIGFILALLLVVVGAWLVWELQKKLASFLYLLGILVVHIWLIYFPPANDVLRIPGEVFFYLWIAASLVLALLVPLLAGKIVSRYISPVEATTANKMVEKKVSSAETGKKILGFMREKSKKNRSNKTAKK